MGSGAAREPTAFRCYAYGAGERWHGICTDLDIAVDGASFREVETALATCIVIYLETVAELPADEQRRFLNRRAPWRVRASLAVSTWIHRLKGAGDRHARSFFLPSHLVAPS